MPFKALDLDPLLVQATREMRYVEPTPIQAEAIPAILTGRDLLATAQTGTGKTAAFLLPILQQLLHLPGGVTRALIITPPRELAQQIDDVCLGLAYHTPLRVGLLVGGAPMSPQEKALRAGVELLVVTPGRLLDHMRQNQSRYLLARYAPGFSAHRSIEKRSEKRAGTRGQWRTESPPPRASEPQEDSRRGATHAITRAPRGGVEDKMRLSKDKTARVVNPSLRLAGIPPEAFAYRLGNRSALEWVIDQYQVSEDQRGGIRSDPNREDDPEYIVRLVGQVVRVSLETVRIVASLPAEYSGEPG
jgi:hypothetical protein